MRHSYIGDRTRRENGGDFPVFSLLFLLACMVSCGLNQCSCGVDVKSTSAPGATGSEGGE